MTENVKTEKRKEFLDVLRVLATLAVVLLHTVTGIMDTTDMSLYPLEKKVFLIALDWITWCVPVFVLISGYLFLNPEREVTFRQMLKKYCRRIVLALFLFGAPYACMELAVKEHGFRPGMLWESFLAVLQGKSWSHMWYLYLILFLYLITPALRALLKRLPKPALYGVLVFLFAGSSLLPYLRKLFGLEQLFVLPDGGIYLFYYLCGYLFVTGEHRGTETGGARSRYGAAGAVFVLLAGMTVSRLAGNYSVQMAYNYPFTVALSLALMIIFRQKEMRLQQKHGVFWRNTGALCFGVYLIHPVFANFYYKFLQITPLNFPAEAFYLNESIPRIALSLPLFFLIILLPSFCAAWVLHRIPFLQKHVL